VAIKVHRADVDAGFLGAVQQVQGAVAEAGMPAPRPLLPPTPLPARDRAQRARMAADLHRFVVLATPCLDAFGAHRGFLTGLGESLFPAPHDRRFDLTKPGAEHIDRIAERAQAELRAWGGPDVVGHADWRVENLRYDAGALSAVYDWDSLVVRPEAALVGSVAGIFSVDWNQRDVCRIPMENEVAAFVADYEHARGRPFSPPERELARAARAYQDAYLARCQWSDPLPPTG
jgi:hypothetical protein